MVVQEKGRSSGSEGWRRALIFVEKLSPDTPTSAKEVADAVGVKPAAAVRYMHRCEVLGLVKRAGRTRRGMSFVRIAKVRPSHTTT